MNLTNSNDVVAAKGDLEANPQFVNFGRQNFGVQTKNPVPDMTFQELERA